MIETQFLEDLINSIEMTAENNIYTPSRKYKPSSMNCIRNMYFQMEGREPEKNHQPYTSVGILECGTDRHVRIQTAVAQMKENGFDCEYLSVPDYIQAQPELSDIQVVRQMGVETLLYNTRYNMSFACDGLIRYRGEYYIIEFKTEGSYKFDSRSGVDPTHYNQATAYAISFHLDNVMFIYIDRNTLQMKAFLLTVTDTMKERVISKIEQCDHYLERNVIPPKDKVDYKVCAWCGYRNFCKSIPKEEFSFEALTN